MCPFGCNKLSMHINSKQSSWVRLERGRHSDGATYLWVHLRAWLLRSRIWVSGSPQVQMNRLPHAVLLGEKSFPLQCSRTWARACSCSAIRGSECCSFFPDIFTGLPSVKHQICSRVQPWAQLQESATQHWSPSWIRNKEVKEKKRKDP